MFYSHNEMQVIVVFRPSTQHCLAIPSIHPRTNISHNALIKDNWIPIGIHWPLALRMDQQLPQPSHEEINKTKVVLAENNIPISALHIEADHFLLLSSPIHCKLDF